MTSLQASASPNFGTPSDPGRFIADIFSALRPPQRVPPSEWATKTRKINNPGSYVGPWDNSIAPYLVEPMDEAVLRRYDTGALVGPGQCGKNACAENIALVHKVPKAPGKVLWYMQTDEAIEAYVKQTINPLIDSHGELSRRLGPLPVDNSLHFKRFDKMSIEFLSATLANLISKNGQLIIADEIDAYLKSLGDVKKQLDIRRQIYGANSYLMAMSHPDAATGIDPDRHWLDGIMRWYKDSTQGRWYWPCPICGKHSSPNPGAKWLMEVVYPAGTDVPLDEVARAARLLCPHEGCQIEDLHRGAMNHPHGKWVHIGQDISVKGKLEGEPTRATSTKGWWIMGCMSPFIRGGIGGLARERVEAERAAAIDGDYSTVKQVMSKMWAWPYQMKSAKHVPIDAVLLKSREDYPLGFIPDGVRFILVAVDTQGDRFVVQVEGYGVDLERWVIDRFDILQPKLAHGVHQRKLSPATYAEDWDVLADELLNCAWAFGSDLEHGLRARLIVFDAFGEDGVTDNAYSFWLRMKEQGAGDRIRALKGEPGFGNKARVIESFLDADKKDKYTAVRGEVPVLRMKVDPLKDSVASGLRREHRGARYINFPKDLPQSFYDEYTAEERGKSGWVKIRTRNESLDLSAYTLGAALYLGADGIDWVNRPPVWAQLGAGNPYYVRLKADAPVPKVAQLENHGVKLASTPRAGGSVVDRLV